MKKNTKLRRYFNYKNPTKYYIKIVDPPPIEQYCKNNLKLKNKYY